ncbi:hypothetical protein Taro_020414, partial [Colocasia esculenta]|nr:hypothetical protein [Colocasia esculenta]
MLVDHSFSNEIPIQGNSNHGKHLGIAKKFSIDLLSPLLRFGAGFKESPRESEMIIHTYPTPSTANLTPCCISLWPLPRWIEPKEDASISRSGSFNDCAFKSVPLKDGRLASPIVACPSEKLLSVQKVKSELLEK